MAELGAASQGLLSFLKEHGPCTREQILNAVYNLPENASHRMRDSASTNIVKMISRLREKGFAVVFDGTTYSYSGETVAEKGERMNDVDRIPKYQRTFDSILDAIQVYKSKNGGEIPPMVDILEQCGVDQQEWYSALSQTKSRSPETAAMYYKAVGKEMKIRKKQEVMPPPCDEIEQESEEESVTDADVLANVIHWLEKASGHEERKRIFNAAAIFMCLKDA